MRPAYGHRIDEKPLGSDNALRGIEGSFHIGYLTCKTEKSLGAHAPSDTDLDELDLRGLGRGIRGLDGHGRRHGLHKTQIFYFAYVGRTGNGSEDVLMDIG